MNGLPVAGICVAMMPGQKMSLIFPVRESTSYKFARAELEAAAMIAVYENAPDGMIIDEEYAPVFNWGKVPTANPSQWMPEDMVIIQVFAQLKEYHAPE